MDLACFIPDSWKLYVFFLLVFLLSTVLRVFVLFAFFLNDCLLVYLMMYLVKQGERYVNAVSSTIELVFTINYAVNRWMV